MYEFPLESHRRERKHRIEFVFCLATSLSGAELTNALTLDDCLRESLSANHALLRRSAETDAARARAKGSTAARLPRLFLQGGAQHTSDPYRLQPATENNQPGIFTRDTWQAGAGVGVPLYTGGRLVAEQDAARLLAEAAADDFAFARQALAVRVVALYQDALALRAVMRSLDQSRATLTAQVERIDALIRQQKAAGVDQLRVSVRLARVDQNAIEARNRLEIVQATLAVLMGREPSAGWELANNLTTPVEPPATGITSPVLRADKAAAQARADSAAQQVRAARSGWLPTVDGVATYDPRADFNSGENYDSGFVGLALTWNIWDFGRTKSRVSEARANLRVREEAATETTLQRRLELANAEASVRSAAARIEASRLAVEQAQESLRIEQRKYELGQGTITDVLDAQSATVESESLRARALADHAISLAARDFAAGHVFTSAAAMPALRGDPVTGPVNNSPSKP
ncbi:MAG: TolC family protein [Verrucomicrobia bacterium]|nr:TolC family protein [Verrucomicrobiota bacterium]